MTLQKTRPTDTMQWIMSSFKQFERKLDKLQDDVNDHGQTLTELRVIMNNFSAGTVQNPDTKFETFKRPSIKATAIQYDVNINSEQNVKTKRKNSIRPLPSNIKAKSFPSQEIKLRNDTGFHIHKRSSNSKATMRPGKAKAPWKAVSLRSQVVTEKKCSKLNKDIGKV